ncbi:MAG: efflux RND transporter periplasmic adaptor subunit [Chlorobiaceae bacterium]|nr:efflux RND transporter periplasmic adaptor subunit [Chlorobiaceae bacterium]MBA4309540.1 efflux RND transporter periplasmic adaptor subunit [Chlorobiaceae bacterium]
MANGNNKKNSKKKIYVFGGLGVLVLGLILLVIIQGSKEEIITVQTEKVEKRNITQNVTATGKIQPEFSVIITPEVTGEVMALTVKEGDDVKKGQVLLRIKADTYLAQKERVEANLQSARASLSIQKAQLDKITGDYNRVKDLHAKRLSSDAEIEASRSLYLTSVASFESAQAVVQQAQASLREANEQLNKTVITSPINGTITKLNIEVGERVLGSGFTQGTDIMTVADLSQMEAIVDVDENDVTIISVGDTTRIKVDAFRDRVFNGIVTQIGNSAKSAGFGTQEQVTNFEVRVRLLDTDINLRPGMSCNGTIETETKKDVVAVPIQSVTARTDVEAPKTEEEQLITSAKKRERRIQEIVFIIVDGKAKAANIETGISDDTYVEVISGLSGGEEVVSGTYRAISRELKDGSLVTKEEKKTNQAEKK